MAKAKDIKFDELDDDIFIDPTNGDFKVSNSDTRHVQDIIGGFTGWWKEFPLVGAGAKNWIASSGGVQRLIRNIKIQLTADGYRVDKIKAVDGQIYVTGERKDKNL